MIELKGLSKTYSVSGKTINAVQPLDLSVQKGDFVSIVGHSGSGKSTLLSLIGGIARPDTGSVSIDNNNIWNSTDKERSRLRNEKFVLPTVFGGSKTRTDAKNLLELVGLGDKADRYPSELSGGEQQRVAIARAFINAPEIILADEPTGDLDEETEAEIMTFFERANREGKVTMIMVTHSSEIALRAKRRFRMKQGILEKLT
jgi:ABC-type lipoprotein export system ATPase subunit